MTSVSAGRGTSRGGAAGSPLPASCPPFYLTSVGLSGGHTSLSHHLTFFPELSSPRCSMHKGARATTAGS